MICTDNAYIERIEKILDKQYWMDKVPEATLNERFIPSYYPEQEIVDPLTPKHKQRLHKEGYFFVKQALHSEITLQLKNIICSLHAQDIHPIFSFVFDDFWKLVNLLKPYVEPLLGRCHTMIPASWVWRIDPQKEEKGWKAHRERDSERVFNNKGEPVVLTYWIPLTDATPDNGCMYIQPAHLDELYPLRKGAAFRVDNLQDIRALPAKVGDLYCWNHRIVHWGGRSNSFSEDGPRISVAYELQAAGTFIQDTYIDPRCPMSLQERLYCISTQALNYYHLHEIKDDFLLFIHELHTYLRRKLHK